jgi:hypothetical protein
VKDSTRWPLGSVIVATTAVVAGSPTTSAPWWNASRTKAGCSEASTKTRSPCRPPSVIEAGCPSRSGAGSESERAAAGWFTSIEAGQVDRGNGRAQAVHVSGRHDHVAQAGLVDFRSETARQPRARLGDDHGRVALVAAPERAAGDDDPAFDEHHAVAAVGRAEGRDGVAVAAASSEHRAIEERRGGVLQLHARSAGPGVLARRRSGVAALHAAARQHDRLGVGGEQPGPVRKEGRDRARRGAAQRAVLDHDDALAPLHGQAGPIEVRLIGRQLESTQVDAAVRRQARDLDARQDDGRAASVRDEGQAPEAQPVRLRMERDVVAGLDEQDVAVARALDRGVEELVAGPAVGIDDDDAGARRHGEVEHQRDRQEAERAPGAVRAERGDRVAVHRGDLRLGSKPRLESPKWTPSSNRCSRRGRAS